MFDFHIYSCDIYIHSTTTGNSSFCDVLHIKYTSSICSARFWTNDWCILQYNCEYRNVCEIIYMHGFMVSTLFF